MLQLDDVSRLSFPNSLSRISKARSNKRRALPQSSIPQ